MKLTPLEIEGHQFGASWRGYDKDEVRAFLSQISLELTQLLHQHSALQEEHRLLKERLMQTDGYEERLREAVLTATQLREQVRDEAEREASVIIREAELRAEELMAQGRAAMRELHSDVLSIKEQRRRATSELRATLESHLKLLSYYEDELASSSRASELKGAEEQEPFFDEEALEQAQELTLMLGDSLAPTGARGVIDEWPQPPKSSAAPKEPVRARLKPRSQGQAPQRVAQARIPQAPSPAANTRPEPRPEPRPQRAAQPQVNNSLHGSEMLQQVLSQIPQQIDPRELSLPPQAIKAEGEG